MDEAFTTRPLVGRWISLEIRPTRPLTWIGPSWAVVCGVLAAGVPAWKPQTLLFPVLALLLCDGFLGAWRALWLQTDWRDALRQTFSNSQGLLSESEPSNNSGWQSVLPRLWTRWAYFCDVIWPIIDSEVIGVIFVGTLALSVAIILGVAPFALSALAMLLGILEGRVGTARGAGLRSIADVAIPWLVAETAMGQFSWLSLLFALLFTLTYRSLLGMATIRRGHWVAWCNIPQLAVGLALIAIHEPVGAGIVLLGLLAQILWQARYHADRDGQTYSRRVQSYVLVTMLIAGLSFWF